jgi:hypothetical protein
MHSLLLAVAAALVLLAQMEHLDLAGLVVQGLHLAFLVHLLLMLVAVVVEQVALLVLVVQEVVLPGQLTECLQQQLQI